MRLLITGADGFVGRWLVREALSQGWHVNAVLGPGGETPDAWLSAEEAARTDSIHADLTSAADLGKVAAMPADAVIHLAAIASGAAARRDVQGAMKINAEATVWLLNAIGEAKQRPRFLFVSTGEVYGAGHHGPIGEDTSVDPVSPYAATKAAAEPAVLDLGPANGMDMLIARSFPHTGPGQSTSYVLPAIASRLVEAKRSGATTVMTGNLDAVRDFLDVRDVVRAYLLLLELGVPGQAYNVASGVGRPLSDCFDALAAMIGVDVRREIDPNLLRPSDIAVLIGNPSKLQQATGWIPLIPFDRTLQDLVDAQAH